MLLRTDNRELCGDCHNPATLTQIHAVNAEQDCIGCHNAHVGVTSKLLRSDAQELTLLYGGGLEVQR
jgi:predicted CXXCH cytochrome family protein